MGEGRVLTGVSGTFTATHVHMEAEPHEHTWEVVAWFDLPGPADARLQRASLDTILSSWHGKALPPHIQSNEEIAAAIATLVCCVEVTVSRPADRLHARVFR